MLQYEILSWWFDASGVADGLTDDAGPMLIEPITPPHNGYWLAKIQQSIGVGGGGEYNERKD